MLCNLGKFLFIFHLLHLNVLISKIFLSLIIQFGDCVTWGLVPLIEDFNIFFQNNIMRFWLPGILVLVINFITLFIYWITLRFRFGFGPKPNPISFVEALLLIGHKGVIIFVGEHQVVEFLFRFDFLWFLQDFRDLLIAKLCLWPVLNDLVFVLIIHQDKHFEATHCGKLDGLLEHSSLSDMVSYIPHASILNVMKVVYFFLSHFLTVWTYCSVSLNN